MLWTGMGRGERLSKIRDPLDIRVALRPQGVGRGGMVVVVLGSCEMGLSRTAEGVGWGIMLLKIEGTGREAARGRPRAGQVMGAASIYHSILTTEGRCLHLGPLLLSDRGAFIHRQAHVSGNAACALSQLCRTRGGMARLLTNSKAERCASRALWQTVAWGMKQYLWCEGDRGMGMK